MKIEINYSPFSYQEQFHLDKTRFRLICGGRRSGKSKTAIQELVKQAIIKPKSMCWWVSPTYRDAREVGFAEFLEHQDELEPIIKSIHHSRLCVLFKNDSYVYFKGSDNPNSLRGRGLDFAVLDEAAFVHKDVWSKALRPALSDKQGRAILTSTPNGKNWFFDQYTYAKLPIKLSWSAYLWKTKLNPLISQEDINEAMDQLSDIDFRQEYEAEFITKAGLIYSNFSNENIIKDFTLDKQQQQFYLGMDFGYAGATCIVFMAVDKNTNTTTQFDEIYVSRRDMESISDLLIDKLRDYSLAPSEIQYAYTDPAGNSEELSSGLSPVGMLRDKGFRVFNKATRVIPGIALVRSMISSAKGNRRFFIHEKCNETIRSINGYSYRLVFDQPVEEPVKDNIHDHACDAIRYFFVNRFDQSKYISDHLNTFDMYAPKKKKKKFTRCGICRGMFISSNDSLICKECMSNAS